MEIFDFLKALTEKNVDVDFDNDEIRKSYQPFLINRFVSMCEVFVPFVNEINKYDLPKEAHFKFLDSVIPKRKYFFNYIKKKKDISEKEKTILANHFKIGKKETEEYINILSEEEIKSIIDIYKFGKNSFVGL